MADSKIVIIGAGPAGLIAGNYLIRAGNRVTIYEQNRGIKSTPCGEGISHSVIEKLRKEIGFNSMKYVSRKTSGLKNIFPENTHSFVNKKGYVIDRHEWLEGLKEHFEKAGGRIVFGKKITSLKNLDYDYLVGADGPASGVRKIIKGKVEAVAAVQYKVEMDHPQKKYLEFYWDKDVSKFYAWNFAKKDYFNVGAVGKLNDLDNLMKKYKMEGKILEKQAQVIPFAGEGIQKKNIVLIGDAAGMANPFSKGGLAPIIYASEILTQCIEDGEIEKYEPLIKRHAAFSAEFYETYRVLNRLSQENLARLGKVSHGHDLFNMPISSQIKILKYPYLWVDFWKVYSGFKKGIEYAW